jgi:hypothetical protein
MMLASRATALPCRQHLIFRLLAMLANACAPTTVRRCAGLQPDRHRAAHQSGRALLPDAAVQAVEGAALADESGMGHRPANAATATT